MFNAHIMYQGAGHQGVSLDDFKELLVEQLIETARCTLSEWKQYMSAVYVKCECVQHLALSAITLCAAISL